MVSLLRHPKLVLMTGFEPAAIPQTTGCTARLRFTRNRTAGLLPHGSTFPLDRPYELAGVTRLELATSTVTG